jgi:hypothetical protein
MTPVLSREAWLCESLMLHDELIQISAVQVELADYRHIGKLSLPNECPQSLPSEARLLGCIRDSQKSLFRFRNWLFYGSAPSVLEA